MKKHIKNRAEFLNEQKSELLAPNDKPSNLSKSLYEYVRSQSFKEWFGDWENNPSESSKILDENGEPMLVYHGSDVKFDKFNIDKQKNGWLGRGFYFTNDKNSTKEYGRFTMKMFLNIRNPFNVKGQEPNDVYHEIKTKYTEESKEDIINDPSMLKGKGHDGIIFNHWDKGNMISCFYPEQIKLVDK